jgi:hypothetical protein
VRETRQYGGQVANLAASGVVIRQNQQIKQTLSEVRDTLDVVKGIGVANLATSLVGIGVTVAATAVLVQRIESLRVNLENFAKEVTAFRDEWRTNELEKLLQAASTELDRIDGVHRRVNGRRFSRRPRTCIMFSTRWLPAHVFVLCAKKSRSPQCAYPRRTVNIRERPHQGIVLMDEAEEAKASAQAQVKTLMDMTIAMPADRLAGRLVGTTSHREEAAALSARMASMRDTAVGILPLVDELQRQDLRASAYLATAENEQEAPLMFLTAKVK